MNVFNIDQYQEVLSFLSQTSNIGLKHHNSEYLPYSRLCIYCDDATRKNPNEIKHGHLYIYKLIPKFRCFRCEASGHLKKLLLDLGFNNRQIISDISKSFNFKFIHDNTSSGNIKHYQSRDLYLIHIEFAKKYSELYQSYLEYIYMRMGNINPIEFGLYPEYNNGQCYVVFTNRLNSICVKRSIHQRKFFKPNQNEFYFFQDFSEIYSTRNVYICEGAVDLINLYNHGQLNNGFYIAMNGTFYNKVINWLIQNHCVIGKYNFHIFFDKNTYKIKDKINSIKQLTLKINQNISFSFYKPIEKDVSELMMYHKI